MTLSEFITKLDDIAWGSVVLCLLVGVGIKIGRASCRERV